MDIQPQYTRLLADTARKIIYQEEEVLTPICDRCGGVDQCICPRYDPIPPLNISDVLATAGYNLKALAEELEVCANCFEPYESTPTEFKGMRYCCRSCAEGGECICEPVPVIDDDASENQPAQNDALQKVNSLWGEDNQASTSTEQTKDHLIECNRFWLGQSLLESPQPPAPGHPRTNSHWHS